MIARDLGRMFRSATTRHGLPGKTRSAEAGLTLVETLFALGILMFGIMALLGPMYYAGNSLSNSTHMALATELASSRMETVKADPVGFFRSLGADRPPMPLCSTTPCTAWNHAGVNQDFNQIPGYGEFATWVILETNITDNTAIIRIPVVWIRPGGKFSTATGAAFDPLNPDANPATIELISSVQYR